MIEIVGVSSNIGPRQILFDVDLRVDKGECLALLGPSGAGKTSLLRIVAGLDTPCSGEIRLSGQTVSTPLKQVHPAMRRISMIFQTLALWPHMTVRENVEFVIQKARQADRAREREKVNRLLEMMHLKELENRYPDGLSGGERQRLAIARALASSPHYLLMDEPFSHLDDVLREELLDITISLKNDSRMTIMYVTHNIHEALYVADKIALMVGGRITRTWSKEEVQPLGKEGILRCLRKGYTE